MSSYTTTTRFFSLTAASLVAAVFVACAAGDSDGVLASETSDASAGDGGLRDGSTKGKDGGSRDDEDGSTSEPPPTGTKRIFATHDQHSGNLGGLTGADGFCEAAAAAANLGGTWKAWLSDSSDSASKRIAKVGPWFLVDGTTVVFDSAGISGIPAHDIDMDEFGETGIKGQVWTGSSTSGTSTGSNCNNWTSTGADGTVGLPHDLEKWADDSSGSPCNLNGRIYCVEQ